MKKIISALAALSVICGSFCAAMPAVAADNNIVLGADIEETAEPEHNIVNGYDLDGSHTSAETDGMTYTVYNDFALLTKVSDTDMEEFTVPDTYKDKPVVGLTDAPFQNCKNLKKINLSKNIAVFDWIFIAEEGIEEITVPEDNEFFTSVDGVIYTKDMKELVACPNAGGKTELIIPDETVSIDRGALACCRDLKKVTMGANVEKIYPSAFWGCSGLTDVNFSQKLKAIAYYAFAGCSSLESVDLPDSLEEMYEEVFKDTACVKIENGIKYVDNWAVGTEKDVVDGTIKEGTIGTVCGMFSNRNKLKTISIPASMKHLADGIFVGLGRYTQIERVDVYNDTIPERSFIGTAIREYDIHDPNCKIADSKNALMPYYVELDKDYTPDEEDEEKPTEYILSHKTVTVSSSGSASSSIQKAINTELVELDEKISYETSAEDIAKADDYVQKYAELNEKIQKQLEERKEKQEQKDTSGFTVAQPVEGRVYSAPIKIGAKAKYDVVIRGFEGSTAEEYALKYRRVFDTFEPASTVAGPEIIRDKENGIVYWKYSENDAYACVNGSSAKEVTIAETIEGAPVKTVSVFMGKSDIVHIPKTAESYRQQVDAAEDDIAYYDVDKDNPYLTSVDGIIYSKDMTKLIKVPSRYAGKKIVVPDGVKTIDNFAFYSLDNVESIELPDSVETIGRCAFVGCYKLSSIKLSEKLDVIGDHAFMSCGKLADIKIPESVDHIGENAFDSVPAVNYDGGLGYLDGWCVGTDPNEVSLTRVVPKEGTVGIANISAGGAISIPKSVTKMGWGLVSPRNNIKSAYVYSHVLDYDAFKNADHMKDIYIYDPECEICAGDQTIPAKHIEVNESKIKGLNTAGRANSITRTPAQELKADSGEVLADTVIHGYKDSTAEAYAKMYGIKFEELDSTAVFKGGDLNGDGALNVADLVMVSRYIHGLVTLDEKQTKSADLNGDGNVDIFDMVEFRKKILESMRDN
ncbi:leucine-rich repeat protein [Ruminococcus flavefaciens]|uniref:leucine-rich repeat protein n=1 Tax=Ruminococcus flavefaciens TaxID=1265 RepID=UPI0026F17174|nr:leucine-rich repeat protein [Ruminococcus flavefaciens]